MEDLTNFVNYVGLKAILMTLVPSLFLNVIIDITRKIFIFTTASNEKLALSGLISFLGLGFGFLYYVVGGLTLQDSCLHAGFISIVSYFFYKIDIYKLLYKILTGILKKFGVHINE